MTIIATEKTIRYRILVNGIVQGVGFRPFVFNLAEACGLVGFVTNSSRGVEIEVEGSPGAVDNFYHRLKAEKPPLAVVDGIKKTMIHPTHADTFQIIPSTRGDQAATLISPDVAVCQDCLTELFDPNDRRYLYPFINCTNCGPRYTIIESIPYDRPFTSMRHFKMCPQCQSEYDNPRDRRFHAQPNACPNCGPRIWLSDTEGNPIQVEKVLHLAVEVLRAGKILALKGLGGFHLAVDASNEEAVERLRLRKKREAKPLAVMFPSLESVRASVVLHGDEARLLSSFQAPIVLCMKGPDYRLAPSIAPSNSRLGVMLPYTPLHHLVMQLFKQPLVMTSANLSEEPICITNEEAVLRLGDIADHFLLHDRDIYLRNDDSVCIHLSGKNRLLRRSRGFTPSPVSLPFAGPSVLAVGAELKNTICMTRQDQAFVSQHIGDMENLETYQSFQKTILHMKAVLEIEPELIVHDLHPDYLSTQWALKQPLAKLAVQHHHAHLAACMAEHGLTEGSVIGIILDGTGFGRDGHIWGGEVLIGDYLNFERFAHLEYMQLPGGNAAIKAPWRTAMAYLYQAFDSEVPQLDSLSSWDASPILEMLETRTNTPLTSSMGRLFDAVAAMAGGPGEIQYEGQAAIEFMQACTTLDVPPFTFGIRAEATGLELCVTPLIRDIARAIQSGANFADISNRFHRTLVEWLVKVALLAHNSSQITQVVLSGGVFQNEILFEALIPRLESIGMTVFTHELVPANDGGLALGQAVIGRKYLESLKLKG